MKKVICLTLTLLVFLTSAALAYSVDINNVDKKQAIDYISNQFVVNGYSIITSNDFSVVVQKEINDIMYQVFYGSRFNTTPVIRISLNFAQVGNNVRLNSDAYIITNPNSAFEKSSPYTKKDFPQMIDRLKINTETNCSKTSAGKEDPPIIVSGITISTKRHSNGNMIITEVNSSSNAYIAGLRRGDTIININEFPVKNLSLKEFETYTNNQKGKQITLKIDSFENYKQLSIEFEAQ